MLMAALDGIQTKARPGEPLDKDVYDLQPEELADVPDVPAVARGRRSRPPRRPRVPPPGDVFTPDVIDTWIWYKQTHEIEALRIRPHPYEFTLYYDI